MVPRLFEVLGPEATIHGAEGIPLLGLPPARLPLVEPAAQAGDGRRRSRPIALHRALAGPRGRSRLAIKLDSPGPVFFRQVRMGKGDRPFRILKFRTMAADADEPQARGRAPQQARRRRRPRMFKIPDDPRITRVGEFLRSTRSTSCPS